MSQAEILDFLEAHKGKWFTKQQIAKKCKMEMYTFYANIKRIIRFKHMWDVEVKMVPNVPGKKPTTYYRVK